MVRESYLLRRHHITNEYEYEYEPVVIKFVTVLYIMYCIVLYMCRVGLSGIFWETLVGSSAMTSYIVWTDSACSDTNDNPFCDNCATGGQAAVFLHWCCWLAQPESQA